MSQNYDNRGARMYDLDPVIQAGINPKTGLPIKMGGGTGSSLKTDLRKNLRIMDEQNAVNRYVWTDLPKGLDGKLIERILYYRGQGAAFKLKDKFYFLPYTLAAPEGSTGIDVYGRFTGITPLPFNGTSNDGKEDAPWIRGLIFTPRYEVADLEEYADSTPEEIIDALDKTAILLHDYTPQVSQTNIPRQQLQEPILDLMSDCLPFMRTALMNGTGVMGMRVGSEDEEAQVQAMSSAINQAALQGRKYVGITGQVDFQELTGGNLAKAEEFLLALQSLDNFRLSMYGLDNGGLFQKKSHMLEAEQEMNTANTGLVADDGLSNRQKFATIFNSYFGTRLWCVPNETTIAQDLDGDGIAGGQATSTEQSAQSTSNEQGGENE